MTRYILIALIFIGCAPGWDQDQKHTSQGVQDTLDALCTKWMLQRMWINNKPLPSFHLQSVTTMELREDNTYRTETQGIWFEGSWEFTGGEKKELKLRTKETNDTTTEYEDYLQVYQMTYLTADTFMFNYDDARLDLNVSQLYIPYNEQADPRSPGQRTE